MENPNLNIDSTSNDGNTSDINNKGIENEVNSSNQEGSSSVIMEVNSPSEEENSSVITELNTQIEKDNSEINDLASNQINQMTESEYVYSLIESAVPNKDGFRKNISKRDFALWVLPIVAINSIRRFTSKRTIDIVRPYNEANTEKYIIKGTETVYTSTKNVFEGEEKMRFFGFRFMSIWVFPMAITGAFMEFLFVGPLNGTNPFG